MIAVLNRELRSHEERLGRQFHQLPPMQKAAETKTKTAATKRTGHPWTPTHRADTPVLEVRAGFILIST